MIKAKVVSFRLSESVDSISKLDLETYLEDQIDLSSFCVGMDFDGLNVVIMTEEEYKALDSVSDVLRKSLLDEREKTRKLEEENKKLEEECKSTVGFCPDGTIVFRSKKVSELEKEVEKLKEENKVLKNKGDEFSLKITGGLFYKKED